MIVDGPLRRGQIIREMIEGSVLFIVFCLDNVGGVIGKKRHQPVNVLVAFLGDLPHCSCLRMPFQGGDSLSGRHSLPLFWVAAR